MQELGSRTLKQRKEERALGERFIREYMPNVSFSEFEIRKIGQMLVPVLKAAQATGKRNHCRGCNRPLTISFEYDAGICTPCEDKGVERD